MVALIAIGLLLHESVYLSSRGFRHFLDDFAPVLRLHLAPTGRIVLHLCFCTINVLVIAGPENLYLLVALLVTLSVLIASFPKRIPNHLPLAWFMLLALGLTQADGRGQVPRGIIQLF